MESHLKKSRRITVKPKQPNPLFEKWLQEWKEEAATRGSDMQYCFGKALASLKKYPLPLNSGRECGILQNFGNRLCVMLDRKLAEHRSQSLQSESSGERSSEVHINTSNKLKNVLDSLAKPQKQIMIKKRTKEVDKKETPSSSSKVRRKNCENYVPAYRSGSYAILLGLLSCSQEENYPGFVMKTDLIKEAQPLCDSSFTKPEPGSFYTAWSSVSSLVKKGFISSAGRGKYALTTTGENLAFTLKHSTSDPEDPEHPEKTENLLFHSVQEVTVESIAGSVSPVQTVSDEISTKENSTCILGKRKLEPESSTIMLLPGSFEVILLIDTHEVSGIAGRKGCNASSLNDLQKQNIVSEIRHLKIGDFVWICKEKTSGLEVVLPYIIERKRVDDFARSIMDGRYREQKFRLKRCGIPNLIYLVEKHGKESHTVLPISTLNQAAVNTEVIDGFTVKYTGNHSESASYLAHFTEILSNLFLPKTLIVCNKNDLPSFSINDDVVSLMSFKEFNDSSIKNKKLCVREMFVKQLVQLNGLSVEKALAIVNRYPTPKILYNAIKNSKDIKLIADIPYGFKKRHIGPVLSKILIDFYSNTVLM